MNQLALAKYALAVGLLLAISLDAIALPQSESVVSSASENQVQAGVADGDTALELMPSSTDDTAEVNSDRASIAKAASERGDTRIVSKYAVLVGSLTVFLLAVFVGFEVITKVPPTLHTPLMSGSNAISGITVVGAMLTAGHISGGFGSFLGMLAVILATVNVVGGFLVTHRMLVMFKKR